MLPFKNILIHEDFTGGSRIAVAKCLEIYEPSVTKIHLVHVHKTKTQPFAEWMGFISYGTMEEADRKLSVTVEEIRSSNDCCKIAGVFIETEETLTKSLARYIKENEIDLIIANRQRNITWSSSANLLDTSKLTELTGCPVLSVTSGCLKHSIKSILLPVSSFVPERKIKMAITLSREFKASIYLLGVTVVSSHNNKANLSAFYHTYKIFRECGYEPQYKIIDGMGTPSELYGYAEEIKADIVLMNPEKETGFFKWLENNFSKSFQPLSPLQILSIKPQLK